MYFVKSTGTAYQVLYSYLVASYTNHLTNSAVIPLVAGETVGFYSNSAYADYNDKYSGVMLFAI